MISRENLNLCRNLAPKIFIILRNHDLFITFQFLWGFRILQMILNFHAKIVSKYLIYLYCMLDKRIWYFTSRITNSARKFEIQILSYFRGSKNGSIFWGQVYRNLRWDPTQRWRIASRCAETSPITWRTGLNVKQRRHKFQKVQQI